MSDGYAEAADGPGLGADGLEVVVWLDLSPVLQRNPYHERRCRNFAWYVVGGGSEC